ncbi:MAG: hypothetical protein LBI13_02060 [Streptococcaceae bacterium]|jgi:hypothetical protein|nr:hypothetical protein [Streptococcaceae bacterium]
MIDWLSKNMPLISALGVSIFTFLAGLIKFLSGVIKNNKSRLGTLSKYTEIYSTLVENPELRKRIENLMEKEISNLEKEIDPISLGAVFLSAIIGGVISYGLIWSVNHTTGIFSSVLLLVFCGFIIFLLALIVFGFTQTYKKKEKVKK